MLWTFNVIGFREIFGVGDLEKCIAHFLSVDLFELSTLGICLPHIFFCFSKKKRGGGTHTLTPWSKIRTPRGSWSETW